MYFSLRRLIASNRSVKVTADENVYVQSMIAEETVCLEEIRESPENATRRVHEITNRRLWQTNFGELCSLNSGNVESRD